MYICANFTKIKFPKMLYKACMRQNVCHMHILPLFAWIPISNLFKLKENNTLGAETFARRKIREIFAFREHKLSRIGQNRFFRVLNFREWTEKLNFFVVLRKRLDPDRNKRETKTLLFQVFVVLGLFFVHQTFF